MPPACPDHGELMLDLARGRLEDDAAAEAEAVLLACPACAAWWERELEAEHEVATGVAAGLAAFRPQQRRWVRTLVMGAAAAGLLVAGAAALWEASWPGHPRGGVAVHSRVANVRSTRHPGHASTPAGSADHSPVLFSDGMESGNLSSWQVKD